MARLVFLVNEIQRRFNRLKWLKIILHLKFQNKNRVE